MNRTTRGSGHSAAWLGVMLLAAACGAAQQRDPAPGHAPNAAAQPAALAHRSDLAPRPAQAPMGAPVPSSAAAPAGQPHAQPQAEPSGAAAAARQPEPVPAAVPRATALPAPAGLGDISIFAEGSADHTLLRAFQCAQTDDFAGYAALNVASNRDTDIALAHLRNYQWKAFRERVAGYVMKTQPLTLRVTRRDNDGGSGPQPKRHKIFLFSTRRDNPAPITLQLEDGQWRIYANSL